MGIRIDISAETPLSDDDRDILAGLSVMMLAIANRQNLADQPHMPDDETEGLEPAPCGFQDPEDPDRYCIGEAGHPGGHEYLPASGLVH